MNRWTGGSRQAPDKLTTSIVTGGDCTRRGDRRGGIFLARILVKSLQSVSWSDYNPSYYRATRETGLLCVVLPASRREPEEEKVQEGI